MFNEPDQSYHGLIYAEHFRATAYIARCRSVYQRTIGAVVAPMSAFLLLQGIETVALRIERHVEKRAGSLNSFTAIHAWRGSITLALPTACIIPWRKNTSAGALAR